MSDLVPVLRRHRVSLAITADLVAWFAAFGVFTALRYGEVGGVVPWGTVAVLAGVCAVAHLAVASALRLYQGRAATGSFAEAILLGLLISSVGAIVSAANLMALWVPRSVPVAATCGTLVIVVWTRVFWRWFKESDERTLAKSDAQRVLIVGAGEASRELVGSMQRDPQRTWRPVGLVDDDPAKRHRRIRGVRVLGTTHDIGRVLTKTGASTLIIAIPSAGSSVIARLHREAVAAGAEVKVLPGMTEMLTEHVGIRDLRDINLNDVLGRNALDTDIDSIAGYLKGKRVLVTGAGGSIGSELCRQIHRFDPAELMMLDRDESALHAVQLSIHGRALLDSNEVVLCDIRDEEAVQTIFESRRPEVVFHAAALKHLPMLEQYPAESVKTNVVGTLNILQAADSVGVERFVNVSTDKAANPESVLGYSKRVGEMLTAARAETAAGTYLSVRFGNVLGSRGSVLTAFAKQIADGGPITVTDPEVTRFFMTIEEACQLVVQAAAIGHDGEALVLDMGAPIKIVDMAQVLIEQAGVPIAIEYTGLRPGEKLHEELFADHEPRDVRPKHSLVSHVPVRPIWSVDMDPLLAAKENARIVKEYVDLCDLGRQPVIDDAERQYNG